jgi:Asp-tRNA(Asn)/Glu-tRNA(Gln) amidotransferase A subunit family amidase
VRNVMLRLTQPFNISGHAAISIPCGTISEGLPVGAQIVAAHTTDALELGSCLEPLLTS